MLVTFDKITRYYDSMCYLLGQGGKCYEQQN